MDYEFEASLGYIVPGQPQSYGKTLSSKETKQQEVCCFSSSGKPQSMASCVPRCTRLALLPRSTEDDFPSLPSHQRQAVCAWAELCWDSLIASDSRSYVAGFHVAEASKIPRAVRMALPDWLNWSPWDQQKVWQSLLLRDRWETSCLFCKCLVEGAVVEKTDFFLDARGFPSSYVII